MGYIFVLLIFFSFGFSGVFIESNYPLRNNNFQKEGDLSLILWALQNIRDVKDIRIKSVGKDTIVYVERYPILKKVEIEGNWFVSDEEIKNILLVQENEPLMDFEEKSAEETLKRYYREKGFLDAEVNVGLKVDENGFAYLKVTVREGDVYFLGGALFKGAKSFSTNVLLREAGLRPGEVYSEDKAKRGAFKLEEFYRKMGFLESSVYFEEVKRQKTERSFPNVLFPMIEGTKESLLSFFKGISNLLSHPIAVTKAIFGKGSLAVPMYFVSEGRRFRINFEGNRNFKNDELLRIVDLDVAGVDIFFLEKTREDIENFYRRKGFLDVKVSYSYKENSILFKIDEGRRYKLKVIGFKGIDLPQWYDEEVIEERIERFLESVRNKGFILANVRILKDVNRRKGVVYLLVQYRRGKRLILKELLYEGKDKEVKALFEKYRGILPTVLDERILISINREIKNLLKREGYLDGDFSVEVKVSEDQENIYFTYLYRVKKGERYRYGRLLVYGNNKTNLREIDYTVVKQKYYSSLAEEESLWNLIQSESFTGVRIEYLLDRNRKEVHRLIELREDKRGIFELAVGYNTEEKLKLEGGVKLKNLFGVGLIADIRVSRSQRFETYQLKLSDKFLFSRKYLADASLFKRLEFHRNFDLESRGYVLSFGYRPVRRFTLGVFFSRVGNDVSGAGEGKFRLFKYGIFLLREIRDDPVSPKNMSHNSLRITRAEGERNYYRIEVNNFFLKELLKGLSVDLKVAGGWSGREAPIFDRFFLGGLRDMKGYDFESIGYPEGGRTYIFGKVELLFLVKDPIWTGIYSDAGNVGNSFSETLKDLLYDMGVAVGVNTPAGFIRLDVATPLSNVEKPFSKFKVYLSIGFVY